MCIHPYGEFELLGAEMTVGQQREFTLLGLLSVHQMPTEADGFLEILVQANIEKGQETILGMEMCKM